MAACSANDGGSLRCEMCDNNSDFGIYFSGDECLGVHCKKCWKEWLLEEYVPGRYDSWCTCDGIVCVSPVREKPNESELLQVTPSRDEININYVEESLKPADHVMWHRPWVIYHHAIVEEVNGYFVTLIHFSKNEDKNVTIHRSTVDVREQRGTLYLIAYDDNIRKYNPAELVLARARSLIGTTGYKLLSRNCENFATFCKTGVNVNQQRGWFMNKLKEMAQSVAMTFGAKLIRPMMTVGAAEVLELGMEELNVVSTYAEAVGAGVIIAFEGGLCIWNLNKLYKQYSSSAANGKKSLSLADFIQEAVTEISRRFLGAGLGAGFGLAATALGTFICPGLGTVLGAVCGIVGGCIGMAIGHAAGVPVGQGLGRAIAAKVKVNDRAVSLEDLEPGDHIVRYCNLVHPRCHAIVVCVDGNQITIIRHSYRKGVIMEVVPFIEPTYRVFHPASISTYSPDEIVQRAFNALDEYKTPYHILKNNCKHFVYSITIKRN